MDERIDKYILPWLGYIERMENDRTAKRCMWEYVGSCLASQVQKRWNDSVNDCSKKSKRKISFFSLALLPFYCSLFHGMTHADPAVVGEG